ncbi:hypothetical protein J7T55_011061 [Diaporthe amygdali]|uniref:uncharacterized protein n=1 Tax=Phomopsis amygdali TaxID=1214568 RepID=UPI0022FEF067|nr:uncharacterized protein J7T55_011061 [Diaporthe amygdali]KAJ0106966.1 hypothetical protein J7T55_011061 [Diaporthe amygdali]
MCRRGIISPVGMGDDIARERLNLDIEHRLPHLISLTRWATDFCTGSWHHTRVTAPATGGRIGSSTATYGRGNFSLDEVHMVSSGLCDD